MGGEIAFTEPTKPVGPFYDEEQATGLREERGWGLVTSVLVVGILLSLSLPLLSLVDTQQTQSSQERKSESSFNLAEAALESADRRCWVDLPETAERTTSGITRGGFPAVPSASRSHPTPAQPGFLHPPPLGGSGGLDLSTFVHT